MLVVTGPSEPLADLTRRLAGHDRVLSAGTLIDSLRFRLRLARRLADAHRRSIRSAAVEAQVVGGHRTSQVMLWSSARVSGVPIADALPAGTSFDDFRKHVERDVRNFEDHHADHFSIGSVVARISEAVLHDEQTVLLVGAYNPDYGVTLSLPSVVGRDGVSRTFEPVMSDEERDALQRSAEALRKAVQRDSRTSRDPKERAHPGRRGW
jgi:L-lactate dehydrogenase